jgi:hypothetical protein
MNVSAAILAFKLLLKTVNDFEKHLQSLPKDKHFGEYFSEEDTGEIG